MKRFLVSGLLVVGLIVGGLVPRASAQVPAEDIEIMVGNLPAAGSALVAGLQEALDVLTSTQSAVETSGAVGDAFVGAGAALVSGSPQFGLLPLGLGLIDGSVQSVLEPYLVLIDDQAAIFEALDDPSMIGDAFNVDDLATLLANAPNVPEPLLQGTGSGNAGLIPALIFVLEGDVVQARRALIGHGIFFEQSGGVILAARALTEDTNYEGLVSVATSVLLVGGPVIDESVLAQVAEPLADGAASLEPVTAPLIELLEGIGL